MALSVKVYKADGSQAGEMNLPASLFEVKLNDKLVSKVVVSQMANRRTATAKTKTRSERRGGGIKPWRQKGTGRARAGTIRSPLWRKGGVTFGPTPERNFTKQVNKKERQKAFVMALSAFASAEEGLVVLEDLHIAKGKTKQLAVMLEKLPVKKSVTIVLPDGNEDVERASQNIQKLNVRRASHLNVLDLMTTASLVIPKSSLAVLVARVEGKSDDTVKADEKSNTPKKPAAPEKPVKQPDHKETK